MPVDRINGIMQQATGMGETGETYLVGKDHTMRSTSRFTAEGETDILVTKAESKGVDEALAGNDWMGVTTDRHGDDTLMAAAPIDFLGVRWAAIANIDFEEVDRPAIEMRNEMIIDIIIVLAVMGVIGFFFARSITKPIANMTEVMDVLANGDLTADVPSQDRTDEIGEMAAAVQVFKANGIRNKEMEAEAEEQKKRPKKKSVR